MEFNNYTTVAGLLKGKYDPRSITQFYRASPEFACINGGDYFKELVSIVDLTGGKYVSIDSRTHMLMEGWYPCIPGFHCDDFYRPEGQPDLEHLRPIKHYSVVIGADVCSTEFLYPIELPSPTEIYEVYDSERPLYGYYNQIIEERKKYYLESFIPSTGLIIEFGGLDFHRGLPAVKAGWRTFTRITVSDHRQPKDEIRTQTQVYLTDPFKGW